jgi:hypothetical protein
VHVVLTEEPALLVANHGELVTAQIVIASLEQIGPSTRAAGEAIGHKGIGFKSVLEIRGHRVTHLRDTVRHP